MKINIRPLFRLFIIIIIIPALAITFPEISQAKSKKTTTLKVKDKKGKKGKKSRKHRRHYNPEKTRTQAIEIIKENSTDISNLAGIETVENQNLPLPKTSNFVYEEGEDITELENEDDVQVDMDSFKSMWLMSVDEDGNSTFINCGIARKDIMDVIMEWLGTPYHFGGTSDRGIDCSGFVKTVFAISGEVKLPRTAQEQFNSSGSKIPRTELQFGDLVFFHTRRHAYASHVGIYLGDNLFAHSSSRYGVTVSSLESTYYNKRFIGARRLSANDMVRAGTH